MMSNPGESAQRNASHWTIKKKTVLERQALSCCRIITEYLENASLHGLRYIGDKTLTILERCFFVFTFLLVSALSIYFISKVWMRWSAAPVIITMNSYSTPVTDLPFPAVTICNMNKAQKSAVMQIRRGSSEYSILTNYCSHAYQKDSSTRTKAGKWKEFRAFLLKVSQPCGEMLISCKYGGNVYPCDDLFSNILTDEGLCCIFNGIHEKFMMKETETYSQDLNKSTVLETSAYDWTPERGFVPGQFSRHGYPRPAVGTGSELGLTVVLNAAIDEYYCSSTNSYGFKVLLHSPNEMPNIAYYGTMIPNGFESHAVVSNFQTETAPTVRSIKKKIRQCVFESENFLNFYRTYSRKNCVSECETNVFMENCGCIMYYMPRPYADINICGRQEAGCVHEVIKQLQLQTNASFACDCLPGCASISYESEFSMAPIIPDSPMMREYKLQPKDASILHVFFRERYFRSQKREEIIGFTEFLSNTGGLLGLFMGFSVVSIIELFYFMSLRPYSILMRISHSRRQAFGRMFQRFGNFQLRKKPSTADPSTKVAAVERISVFPYTN